MEFADLNEEIGADGWLIPRQEITRRRLVRQTKQYKIYRADWFGDVLVYEPKCGGNQEEASLSESDMEKPRQLARYAHKQQDFSSRLSELCLKLNSSATSGPMSPLYSSDDDDGHDSAYSSVSSTPTQFNARHTKQHEFQFPSSGGSLTSVELQHQQQQRQEDILISDCPALYLPAEQQDDHDDNSESSGRKSRKSAGLSSPPVILNKSSFFHVDEEEEQSDAMDNATHIRAQKAATTSSSSSWFELNELRLVAHENFLLFMGASLEHDQLNDSSAFSERSLVMQMSHPKSMSLFNLLHANKCDPLASSSDSGTCSPIDRFFANGRQQQQQQHQKLTINAKLNICQQVTNAMTYLHDKNIVHGRLTSVNIYLELNQRVKISLLDNDELPIGSAGCNSTNSISLNLPTLTYLSPELVQTISVSVDDKTNNTIKLKMDSQRLTKESDIYSFGTLLYELFHEKFPFAQDEQIQAAAEPTATTLKGAQLFEQLCLAAQSPTRRPMIRSPRQQTPVAATLLSPFTTTMRKNWNGNIKYSASELIFHIGSGQTKARNLQETTRKTCPALVDQIISTCWSSKPHERPTFKQLRYE